MPSLFLNLLDQSELLDIQLDEHRNLLYSLGRQSSQQSFINVYDLGILGGEFVKVATIFQSQLKEKIDKHLGVDYKEDSHSQMLSIHPILSNESHLQYLLVVTQTMRIRITFEEQQDNSKFDLNRARQQSGIQFDQMASDRPKQTWSITSIESFPECDE